MNSEIQKYELIDRYLNKELSKEELEEFDLKISQDSEFAELVEDLKAANEVIIDEQLLLFKERMKKDLDSDNGNSFNWKKPIIFSSVILVSLSTGYYFYSENNKVSPVSNENTYSSTPVEESESFNKESNLNNVIALKNDHEEKRKINRNTISPNEKETKEPIVDFVNQKENSESIILPEGKETIPVHNFIASAAENMEGASICNNVKISGITNTIDGCIGKTNGTISIDINSIKGGTPPYLFSIKENNFSSQNKFTNLNDGYYFIRIKDKNNCMSILDPVSIQGKWCRDQIDDAFMPENGETWKFPLIENIDATIRITSKAGSLVYTSKISGGYPYEWDGRGTNGNNLDAGIYYFIMEYDNGQTQQGYISIVK